MILNLTPLQEFALEGYLKNYDQPYKWYSNSTCGDPIENELENFRFDMGNIIFPVGLGNTLMENNMVGSYNFYGPPEPNPSWWQNAPWTFTPGWWSGHSQSIVNSWWIWGVVR